MSTTDKKEYQWVQRGTPAELKEAMSVPSKPLRNAAAGDGRAHLLPISTMIAREHGRDRVAAAAHQLLAPPRRRRRAHLDHHDRARQRQNTRGGADFS